MKKVLPLVLLFAVLIYILPLAALFFPSGKNEESVAAKYRQTQPSTG